MSFIERALVYGPFSDGKSIGDWDLDILVRKIYKSAEPFTYAEKHALMFFEEMGDHLGEREKIEEAIRLNA